MGKGCFVTHFDVRYMGYINMEVIGIELHPNNMNREDIFHLSKSWKPLIYSLKEHRKFSS
jgi:hypothetical protein